MSLGGTNHFTVDSTGNIDMGTSSSTVTVRGDFVVQGTSTSIDTSQLVVEDVNIKLAKDNSGDLVDIGVYGQYNDGTNKFAGYYRDASDGVFKFFEEATTEPGATVTDAGTDADVQAGRFISTEYFQRSTTSSNFDFDSSGAFSDAANQKDVIFLANTDAGFALETKALDVLTAGDAGVIRNLVFIEKTASATAAQSNIDVTIPFASFQPPYRTDTVYTGGSWTLKFKFVGQSVSLLWTGTQYVICGSSNVVVDETALT